MSFDADIPLTDTDDKLRAMEDAKKARKDAIGHLSRLSYEDYNDESLYLPETASGQVASPVAAQEAQRQALAQMAALSRGGGNAIDANQMRMMQGAALQQAPGIQAVAAQGQATGMGGQAARLQGLQGLYRSTGAIGAQAEDDAKRRALAMMRQRGQLSSAARRQSFDESRHRSAAKNNRQMNNVQHRRDVLTRNTGRRNRQTEQMVGQTVGNAESMDARALQARAQADERNTNLLMAAVS